MNAKNLFENNPKLKQAFISWANEAFEHEDDAKAHANHFNVSLKKVMRGEVIPEAIASEQEGEKREEEKEKKRNPEGERKSQLPKVSVDDLLKVD